MKKILLVCGVMMCLVAGVYAQEETPEKRDERIDALKIAFITERLELTSKEASGFWPVYNEFEAEMKKLRKKNHDAVKAYKAKTNPTEQESEKFLNDQLAAKQQEVDLIRKYIPEFKKVLPADKVAKLMMIEHDFKKRLLQRLKDKKPDKG